MKQDSFSSNKSNYSTTETKLAALLLAAIPEATFQVEPNGSSLRKTINILYSKEYEQEIDELIMAFIERRAVVEVYKYNRCLNILRDAVRER